MAASEYELIERLWLDSEFSVYRACRTGDQTPVLLVTPAALHPVPASLARLEHEFRLRTDLDAAFAAVPLALVRAEGRTTLVFADPGGEPLDHVLQRPLDLPQFLRIAIALATALGQVHQRGLIHKDVKPAHILVDVTTGQVRLIGFGIASRIPREHQTAEPMQAIASTFAYMAPEQTGRMNRSIDSRSDLYSLGVTLYEMLTGGLPFTATEPIEWMHCHIARRPIPPCERTPSAPEQVSAIVMRLLAKTAEERYQTAVGLAADLRRCLREWEADRSIGAFPLAAHDMSTRLLIPEKLHGRERESAALLAAFERVVMSGTPELVLVSGYSGIGKSAIVNELHKAIMQPRAIFISGKFDQYQRDIPYATLAQAFRALVRQILSLSDDEVARWRSAIQDAVGRNGQLLVDIIPELELIIGRQTAVSELGSAEANNRFQAVFRQFVGACASATHPLVVFFDDLQWVDAASLQLLEHLITYNEVRHLLVIGAYRDNEVDAAHPLQLCVDRIRNRAAVVQIVIAPLSADDLAHLVADTLHCSATRAAPLASLLFDKTAGNPFFAIQFLTALPDEGLLSFDAQTEAWRWDIERIRAKQFADNVVDLMVNKLKRLPAATLDALQLLACLGNSAEVFKLAMVLTRSDAETDAVLWDALCAGYLVKLAGAYRFVHDRIQEAAYSLIALESRPAAHLRIGRLLWSRLPAPTLEDDIFDLVNHLNRGAALMADAGDRAQLCRFNVIAGKKAKASIAHAAARDFFERAEALLPDDAWTTDYRNVFAITLELAESEYLTGHFERADELFDLLSERARTDLDYIRVARLRLNFYRLSGKYDRALAVGLDTLRRCGVACPESDQEFRSEFATGFSTVADNLGGRRITDLANAPPAVDPLINAKIALLNDMTLIASAARPALCGLLILRALNLSLVHGNTETSCHNYGLYGCLLHDAFSDAVSAFAYSEMAIQLSERSADSKVRANLVYQHAALINFWRRPFSTSLALLEQSFLTCIEAGDLVVAGNSAFQIVWIHLEIGTPLDQVLAVSAKYRVFAEKTKDAMLNKIIRLLEQFVANMQGTTTSLTSFDGAEFSEAECLAGFERTSFGAGIAAFGILKEFAASIYDQRESALEWGVSAAKGIGYLPGMSMAAHTFYYALTLTASQRITPADTDNQTSAKLAKLTQRLQAWATNCPENFHHRYALVSAEMARTEGRERDAERLYEEAIRSARDQGFVQYEALANEFAARFHLNRGIDTIGYAYLRNARHAYVRWGAIGKVSQLDACYPGLEAQTSLAQAPAPRLEHLDLLSVIKASQAVSGEIVFVKLIETLLRLVVEHAGADRALLLLTRGDLLTVEAEATTDREQVAVTLKRRAATPDDLPAALLHYVGRSRERVLLDDAAAPNLFSDDRYIRTVRPRSVLCLPLCKQTKLVGVLYLENKLAPGAFTADRIAVLELLASQAAISIENAMLFGDLQQENTERRRAEEALQLHRDHLEELVVQRTAELVEKNLELERLSITDRLTGLYNRLKLDNILDVELARSQRYATSFALVLLDIDHFKSVNDTHGHQVGDQVLVAMARILTDSTREVDVAGRWGGEEFLIVASNTGIDGAQEFAEKLRERVSAHVFATIGNKTASFGITAYRHGDSIVDMMARADEALYRAKESGRNRVECSP